MLDLLRSSLDARKVTLASIPQGLARNWVDADGRARIEAVPSGDPTDNGNLVRFSDVVRNIAPHGTGPRPKT
jgi:uncharacterized protein